jgi:nucleoside-diphosphate-sugar epimerase
VNGKIPTLIITGASGFVGRTLLDDLKNDHRIFAIARRSQEECNAPIHPNIAWIRADISEPAHMSRAFREINTAGGADHLLHLAAFYEFAGENTPEYRTTNVDGTKIVLEHAKNLDLKLLMFASSVAACSFPEPGEFIDENSPPDGEHIYAWSKRVGEEMIRNYAKDRPAIIARFGAVYSDWCEYPPLFMFLNTWLGNSWRAHILAGKGISAIPYIHIRDITSFIRKLLNNYQKLSPAEVLVACTKGATTHLDLYTLATKYYHGRTYKAIFIPQILSSLGLFLMYYAGKLVNHLPFERPWMRKYIDLQLNVENKYTTRKISWSPNPRYLIENRIPFMLERLKSEPYAWHMKNMVAMRRVATRPDFKIYNVLSDAENVIIEALCAKVTNSELDLSKLKPRDDLSWFLRLIFRLILTSIHSNNRLLIQNYFEISGLGRLSAGYSQSDIKDLLKKLNDITIEYLKNSEPLREFHTKFYDYITMPIEFGIDEIDYQYTKSREQGSHDSADDMTDAEKKSARELLEDTIWKSLVNRY